MIEKHIFPFPFFVVGGYIRLSKEDNSQSDFESASVQNQKDLINLYISQSDDLKLHDFYIDDGYTGTNFNRPNFKRLIGDVEAGIINCIIVKDLSRFSRDYIQMGDYLEKYFIINNIRFISINDNFDSLKNTYDTLLPLKNLFNYYYSRDLSLKLTSNLRSKQEKGEFIGAFACYGYKKDKNNKNKLVIDEPSAIIVQRIFSLYIQGLGKLKIAHILNDEKVPPPSIYKDLNGEAYKNPKRLKSTTYWTYSTIHKILKNQTYRGNMVQHTSTPKSVGSSQHKMLPENERIIVENTHPCIIDKATWEQTQNLLKVNKKEINFNKNNHIFSGKLICGDCGRAMLKTRLKTKDEIIPAFICRTYSTLGKEICSHHTLLYTTLENLVLKAINISLDNLVNIEKAIKKGLEKDNNSFFISSLENEISAIEVKLNKIYILEKNSYENYKENIISKNQYIDLKNMYTASKNDLKKRKSDLTKQLHDSLSNKNILEQEWITSLRKYKNITSLDRIVISELIDVIKVYKNNRVEIIFKFSEDMDTLSAYSSSLQDFNI